jgi:hypothetical protein
VRYAYEILGNLTKNPRATRINTDLSYYFVNIIKALATPETLGELDLLLPDIIKPNNTHTRILAASNSMVIENAPGVGQNGGKCTCPDGTKYFVGDNKDSCKTLACIGGESGKCNMGKGEWSGKKVVCGTGDTAAMINSGTLAKGYEEKTVKKWQFIMTRLNQNGINFVKYVQNGFSDVVVSLWGGRMGFGWVGLVGGLVVGLVG